MLSQQISMIYRVKTFCHSDVEILSLGVHHSDCVPMVIYKFVYISIEGDYLD